MSICHIVAMSENGVIGHAGKMPWHIPSELKHFKDTTMGNCLLMGRKTYESIGKPLPGRFNVVVSRSESFSPSGVKVAHDLDSALAECHLAIETGRFGPDIFVVGGGEIYRASMDLVDKIYLTVIHREMAGDTFYPTIDLEKYTTIGEKQFSEPEAYTTKVLVRR